MGAEDDLAKLHGLIAPARITEGITNRQMAILLKEAAAEMEDVVTTLMTSTTFSNKVKREQLRQLTAAFGPISTELWTETGQLTKVGMFAQAQLAADQALDRDFLMGMPGQALTQYSHGMHMNANAGIEAVLSRRTNGYTLQQRIYANGQRTTKAVGKIVEQGLLQQTSARNLAKQVKQHFRPDVPGGTSYAAKRLARTEINNAHHETTIRNSELRPWVLGYKWNLSSSHPRPDPCDDLAQRDSGQGPGVYAKGNAPSRPHPQCMCYLTHLQEDADEFMNKALSGQYDDWFDGFDDGGPGIRCT